MPIGLVAFFIGIFLIVWNALIWKKLRVVDAQLALMQNELKKLRIIEARLFHLMLNAPTSLKEAPDTKLSTSAPAAAVTKPVGLAGHRRAALDEHIAELYAKHDEASPHVGSP